MIEDINILELQPDFINVNDGWALSLAGDSTSKSLNPNASPPPQPLLVRCRSENAFALVERVYKAKKEKQPIFLRYHDSRFGVLEKQDPILAARAVETPDGHIFLVWVR